MIEFLKCTTVQEESYDDLLEFLSHQSNDCSSGRKEISKGTHSDKTSKWLSQSQERRFMQAAGKRIWFILGPYFSFQVTLFRTRIAEVVCVSACRFGNRWKRLSTPCNITPGLVVSGHLGHAYFAGKRFYFGCGGGTDACLMPFNSSLYLPMFLTPLGQLNRGRSFLFLPLFRLGGIVFDIVWTWNFVVFWETDLENWHFERVWRACFCCESPYQARLAWPLRHRSPAPRGARASPWQWRKSLKMADQIFGRSSASRGHRRRAGRSQWRPDVFV